jgi:hypothetical protein
VLSALIVSTARYPLTISSCGAGIQDRRVEKLETQVPADPPLVVRIACIDS